LSFLQRRLQGLTVGTEPHCSRSSGAPLRSAAAWCERHPTLPGGRGPRHWAVGPVEDAPGADLPDALGDRPQGLLGGAGDEHDLRDVEVEAGSGAGRLMVIDPRDELTRRHRGGVRRTRPRSGAFSRPARAKPQALRAPGPPATWVNVNFLSKYPRRPLLSAQED